MESTWYPLQLRSCPEACPPLFVRCDFGSSDYTIRVTDLGQIWGERLDRPGILQRARADKTSIDPTDDSHQLGILLDTLEKAVKGGQGTSRRLTNFALTLKLQVTAPLPPPLDAFQWDIHLQPYPHGIRAFVVQPLLDTSFSQNKDIDDLITRLDTKDRIIAKLLDKLEGSGIDVSSIFPGAAGLKPSKDSSLREQAGRYIPGLAPFDKQQWRKRESKDLDEVPIEKVVSEVFGLAPPMSKIREAPTRGDWWNTLPVECSHSSLEDPGDTASDGEASSNMKVLGKSNDANSGLQPSPSHTDPTCTENHDSIPVPKSSHANEPAVVDSEDEETTDDEDDLDAPCRPSTLTVDSTHSSQAQPGTVTGSHDQTGGPEKLNRVNGTHAQGQKVGAEGAGSSENVAAASLSSDKDNEARRDAPEPTPSAPASSFPVKKSKLGRIGGKANTKEVIQTPSPSTTPSVAPPVAPSAKPIRNKIGGKQRAADIPGQPHDTADGESRPGPTEASNDLERRGRGTPAASAERETSQERADRKREQLKRELAEKSKGPAKKKRRF